MDEVLMMAIVFITCYMVIELLVRRKERLMIVEKASANQSIDVGAMLKGTSNSFSALKIGCLLAGLGIGFLVGFVINRCAVYPDMLTYGAERGNNYYFLRDMANIIYAASVLTFGGIGLILSYLLEKSKK